jgi:hypothetical protein
LVNRFLAELFGCTIDQVVKGDDSVIAFKTQNVFPIKSYAELFGFEVKPIWRRHPDQVEFASSYALPVLSDGQQVEKLFRLPKKIIARTSYSLGKLNAFKARQRFAAKAYCEYLCNRGHPIIGALTEFWLRSISVRINLEQLDSSERYRFRDYQGSDSCILPDARDRFAFRFNIDVSEQLSVEHYLRNLSPGCTIVHPVLLRLI